MAPIPPRFNERRYAPYKIAALVEVLAEQGIGAEALLHNTGISPAELQEGSVLTSVRQYFSVCQNALQLAPDPATPFRVGTRLHLSAYGMYGYALMSCLSLRDYFRLGVKYHQLATPTLTIQWTEYPDKMVWSFPDAFSSHHPPELHAFLIEQQFCQHVTHLQDVAGKSCPPMQASLAYPAPAHAPLYSQYLKCPCVFDQEQCELIYDSTILDQKPQLAHKLTASMIQKLCDDLIGHTKTSTGIAGEVYQKLMKTPGVFPDMEEVAQALHMTSRTLRRHLQNEGTSFVNIMDDVRRSLALEYLQTTRLSTDDIAMLLGFSDTANFRRALKRWTGKGTRELRQ